MQLLNGLTYWEQGRGEKDPRHLAHFVRKK